MDISHADYQVHYNESDAIVRCHGSFRLHDEQYKPIFELFMTAAEAVHESITLDLRGLRFLNSSGIHVLLKFVMEVRKHETTEVVVLGSTDYPWQRKVLRNLQRIMPSLTLDIG